MKGMAEKNLCGFEECSVYGGDLEEETLYLVLEQENSFYITTNTGMLTIICC